MGCNAASSHAQFTSFAARLAQGAPSNCNILHQIPRVVVFAVLPGAGIGELPVGTCCPATATTTATSARHTTGRRQVRRMWALSGGDYECDGISFWICILLPVCVRRGGEARPVSCNTYACADVAIKKDSCVRRTFELSDWKVADRVGVCARG